MNKIDRMERGFRDQSVIRNRWVWKRVRVAIFVALLAAVLCPSGASAEEEATTRPALVSRKAGGTKDTPEASAERSPGIVIGVEYASIDSDRKTRKIADVFAEAGVSAVKLDPAQVTWGSMQKSAKASIEFKDLDAFVSAYQAAGFTDLLIVLNPASKWASVASGNKTSTNPTPKPEFMDAYTAWVSAVVERYDADGVDDMPDLYAPVSRYEVGTRLNDEGSMDEYLAMLEAAYRAAHEAFSDVQVIHAGFFVTPAFLQRPAGMEQVEAAFEGAAKTLPRTLEDLRQILERPELFDLVNLHPLGNPYEIEDLVRWVREEMTARGYEKPIILGDTGTSPFMAWGAATEGKGVVVPPATQSDRARLAAYFTRLRKKDEEALRWVHRFAAADMVKKIIVAAEQDVMLINTAYMQDLSALTRRGGQGAAGNAAWAGMIDARGKQRRPGLFALDQVVRFLGEYDRIERLPVQDDRVRVYEITEGEDRRWVAWAEAEKLLLPGSEVPLMEVDVPVTKSHLMVELMATGEGGDAHPTRRTKPAHRGVVTVTLTPNPVFLSTRY